MKRTKKLETQKAFENATLLFWEKGFKNTSLQDLLKVMDIQNGSFYNTFGNKKNLFIKTFEAYEKDFSVKRSALFNSKANFKKKIRALFAHVFDRQETACPKGCFLFNSVSSDTLEDKDLQHLVRKGIDHFETFLRKQIKIAIDNGEVDDSIDPEQTASILITYIQGIIKLCVLDYSDLKFREQTEHFLTLLKL